MKNYLKNSIIYQVFVRNYTKEGTFKALENHLDNIFKLDVDILYLLPINEIGLINRKGDLGSPYSIKDYLKINPELGDINDLKHLINEVHKRNKKIIIDIVFNHTSRDSFILNNHPEWMYHNENNEFSNKVGDWSDVFDLDTSNKELIKYLVDVIDYYSSLGIDGYRFDVASLISKDFYKELKLMLDKKYPDTILLAESTHSSFINYCRDNNFNSLSDNELISLGFDLLYNYNSIEPLQDYINNYSLTSLIEYKTLTYSEEVSNSKETLRIRGLENHDQIRICEYNKLNKYFYKTLLAFPSFLKGPLFIYNGLESKSDHKLDLFTKDLLSLEIDNNWYSYLNKIIQFKKNKSNLNLLTSIPLIDDSRSLIIKNTYLDKSISYGLFNFSNKDELEINLIKDKNNNYFIEDGIYIDYLSNKEIIIKDHKIKISEPLFLFKK